MKLKSFGQSFLIILRSGRIRDGIIAWITLMVGAGAVLGADFGMPVWWQIPLYLWLVTVGLPTTVTVILLATMWGHGEPFYGLGWFLGWAVVIAPIMQTLVARNLLPALLRRPPFSRSNQNDPQPADSPSV